MPKPELEFFRPDHIPWQPVVGSPIAGASGPGVKEKILSRDPESGDVTRITSRRTLYQEGQHGQAEVRGMASHLFLARYWA